MIPWRCPMVRTKTLACTAVLTAALALGACSSDDDSADASVDTGGATPAAEQDAGEEQPASDIEAAVQAFTGVLNELDIDYSEPVRAEVQMSGAKARFDMTVNGYDSGINVYPDEESMANWQEASDSFGGIHVAFDNAVLTLNTDEGVADSAEIAPQIAEAVGGTAHGV